jgi:hypothetical protein
MSTRTTTLERHTLVCGRFVCQPCRAEVSCLVSPAFGGDIEPILHTTRLDAPYHRTCHSGRRTAHSVGPIHPLSVGPQVEPWPFKRARKAHLAIAPHRQRHGASNELVVSRRSAGHGRAPRSRLSAEPSSANCCLERCSSQGCRSGSNARRESTCHPTGSCATAGRTTACNSGGNLRGRVSPRPRTPRSFSPGPARRCQLHVWPLGSE